MSSLFFCFALLLGLRELCNNIVIYKLYKHELRISPALVAIILAVLYLAEIGYFMYQGSPATPKQQYLLGIFHAVVFLLEYKLTIPAASIILLGLTFLYAIAFNLSYMFSTVILPQTFVAHGVLLLNIPFILFITYVSYTFGKKYSSIINTKKNKNIVAVASIVTLFSLITVTNISGFAVLFTPNLVISRTLIFSSGILFLVTFFIFLQQIETNRNLQERLSHLEKLQETEKHYYDSVLESQQETVAFQKQIHTQTGTMLKLLETQRYDELETIFNSLLLSSEKLQHVNLCGHQIIDAVVGYWQLRSWEKAITFQADIRVNDEILINDIDLAVILGNALENAYTATLMVSEASREIQVKLTTRADVVLIAISNTFNGIVKKNEEQFYSAKRNFTEPGTGLANIQLLTEKYNGYMQINCEEQRFTIKLALANYLSQ